MGVIKSAYEMAMEYDQYHGMGTTVVWHNVSDRGIQIVFPEGKECEQATESAMRFKLSTGTEICYITEKHIPPNGTASAFFKELGKFNYEVRYADVDTKKEGAVFVKSGTKRSREK